MYLLQSEIWLLMGLSVLFGYFDLRSHRVPVLLFVISFIMGFSICILNQREAGEVLRALLPGVLMILLSFCSGGEIGIGDGHYFLIAGLFLEWRVVIVLLAVSFLLVAAVSLGVILYGIGKGKNMKRKKLPFLSFLPLAFFVTMCL